MKKKIEKTKEVHFVSFLFSFAAVFLLIFLVISNVRMFQRRGDIQSQIKEKEKEIRSLSQDHKEIEYPEEYNLEKMIREQLLMRKPGEEVVFVSFPEEEVGQEIKEQEVVWWNPLTWKKR